MERDADPGSIPAHAPRMILNAVHRSGQLISAPGQSLVTPSSLQAATAHVRHVVDHQPKPTKNYVVFDGCPGVSSGVGFSIGSIDHEQSPYFQNYNYYPAAASSIVMGKLGGVVLFNADNVLKQLVVIPVPFGDTAINLGGATDRVLHTYTGFTSISAISQDFDGKAAVGLDAGAGASAIWIWDGSGTQADLAGINVPQGFGNFREVLVAGFSVATGHIRYRAIGDPPGAWTTQAAAGAGMSKKGVSYKDGFYFGDGDRNVWKWTGPGGTLTAFKTFGVGAVVTDVATFNGYLYVIYTLASAALVARYDNSSWVDVHKSLTAQIATITAGKTIVEYRGGLHVGAIRSSGARIYSSPGTATDGTWTETIPAGASEAADVLGFMVN